MFDGTDLSLAYGGASYEPLPSQQAPMMPQQVAPPPPPPPIEMHQSTMSHAQPPDVSYAPPIAMYAQQPMQQQYAPAAPPQDSLWDRISQKKVDVMKLFVLSLVVLLGVSMDRVATHYLSTYVGKAFLTDMQELLVRLSYPIIILVIIWLIKALA